MKLEKPQNFKYSIYVGSVLFQFYVMSLAFKNLFKKKENPCHMSLSVC